MPRVLEPLAEDVPVGRTRRAGERGSCQRRQVFQPRPVADPAAEVHQPARRVEGDDADDATVADADGDVGLDQLDALCPAGRPAAWILTSYWSDRTRRGVGLAFGGERVAARVRACSAAFVQCSTRIGSSSAIGCGQTAMSPAAKTFGAACSVTSQTTPRSSVSPDLEPLPMFGCEPSATTTTSASRAFGSAASPRWSGPRALGGGPPQRAQLGGRAPASAARRCRADGPWSSLRALNTTSKPRSRRGHRDRRRAGQRGPRRWRRRGAQRVDVRPGRRRRAGRVPVATISVSYPTGSFPIVTVQGADVELGRGVQLQLDVQLIAREGAGIQLVAAVEHLLGQRRARVRLVRLIADQQQRTLPPARPAAAVAARRPASEAPAMTIGRISLRGGSRASGRRRRPGRPRARRR